MSAAPSDRIRTLLLRADNLLKNSVDDASGDDRAARARAALIEARTVAQDPAVDARVRELVDRRITQVDLLAGDAGA